MGIGNGYVFRNGLTIEQSVSMATRAWGEDRGRLVIDSILEIFTPEELLEWVIEDNHLVIRKKDVPDFGEFESSKDVLEYIGGGANAGDICRHS